jgi:type I restriction enzyme S subunit
LNINHDVDKIFIYDSLQTSSIRNFFNSELTGSTIKNLSLTTIKNCEVSIPTLPEQQKIASFLSAIDEKIQQLTRKKELLEQYKKGVMQQLFSGKLRFKDENGEAYSNWEDKRLQDVCEVNPTGSDLPESFIYIDLESVESGHLRKENKINKEDAPSRAQRGLLPNDILYQTVRPYQMNNLLFDKVGYYVASTGYAQLRAKQNAMFLFQLLHTDDFMNDVMERCTGTSFPAINSKDLAKIKIRMPHIEEQQKIATYLSSIDTKIESVTTQINKSQMFKKGLLQQMFV